MNVIGRVGQFAGTLYAGGAWGWLAFAAALVLTACGAAVFARGIAAAHRTRRRNGRHAAGPPPGGLPVRVPLRPVGYAPGVPRNDGRALRTAEAQAYAGIVRRARNDSKARMARRRRGPARRTRERTGKR